MPSPLTVAAEHYYYKPMAIFFNALHLRAFKLAGVRLISPVLDIGCGDGEFGVMLSKIVGEPRDLHGIDLDPQSIEHASEKASSLYTDMKIANAGDLPFKDDSFQTVVAGASMVSIDPGLEKSLQEILRVLKPGGSFYATVCTDRYEQNYWLSRLLKGLGCHRLARRYMDAMNRRLQQAHLLPPESWVAAFESNGFEVRQCFGFMPLSYTPLWSFLAWTPWRIHGLVKLIPGKWLKNRLRHVYRRLFLRYYEAVRPSMDPEGCGYIFLEAVPRQPVGQ